MEVDLSVAEPKSHELKVVFDPVKQTVVLQFDPKEFKTWDYILGVIEMARSAAEFSKQQAMMIQAIQQQQAQQQGMRIMGKNLMTSSAAEFSKQQAMMIQAMSSNRG